MSMKLSEVRGFSNYWIESQNVPPRLDWMPRSVGSGKLSTCEMAVPAPDFENILSGWILVVLAQKISNCGSVTKSTK